LVAGHDRISVDYDFLIAEALKGLDFLLAVPDFAINVLPAKEVHVFINLSRASENKIDIRFADPALAHAHFGMG